jgi:type I restriction enzyme S subunit
VYSLDFPCKSFFNIAIRSKAYVQFFQRFSKGIRVDQWDLTPEALKTIPFAFPPLPEQEAIVRYLDETTGKIDKAIAAEERLIELLQERKQIIINEAVGGNLSHAEAQRGRERRGWKASTIKRYFEITLGKMLCTSKLSDDYTLEKYFCAADVHFGDLNITDNKQMWFSRKEREQYLISNGDLLIVEGGAGAGGACVVNGLSENFYIQNSVLRLRSRGGVSERFVCYVLEGIVKRGYIEMACNKATIPHFTKEKVGEVPLNLPPLPEQEAIVKYLDEETGKIDRAIEVKRRQIALLRERREIIIDEVVTGKVKVA